jgi:single-stranded-DNA-specific exonuclease
MKKMMLKKWELKERKNSDYDETALEKYGSVVLELLSNRGVCTVKERELFFDATYEKISGMECIFGMSEAVERILLAKNKKERIAIFGDYDADGVTATALLFEVLSDLGFSNLTYYIPDRQLEGYGMNKKALEFLAADGVNLIITVDSGITNVVEVEMAKKMGMDVIITDHHHIPEILPTAVAVINPHLENSGFAFSDLAGVGVAFKLAQNLYRKISPKKSDQLKWLLDLVAIGTVADCVQLLGENRILVKYGLVVLSKTRRIGLREMFKVGKMEISEDNFPDTQKISFQIAPRINAAGRMDHASVSYKLIMEKNQINARMMALDVESKNQERQKITTEIMKEIETIVLRDFADKRFVFVSNPHWPVGILGLVAGKAVDKFGKPIVVFQDQETVFVGSLRSIPEINIIEKIETCSDLLSKFGGHSQAAGVCLVRENILPFCEEMTKLIEAELENKEIIPRLAIDLEISAEQIDWKLLDQLKKMEPFGMGNKEPVFLSKKMQIVDIRTVGTGNKHLKLMLKSIKSGTRVFDAIGFKLGEEFAYLKKEDIIDVVFNLAQDEWNGTKKIQLKLIDLRTA